MSLGVANVSESMSSDAVPYTCSARRPRCRPARAALGARRAQAAGGAGAHQALLAQRRALRLRLGRRLRARRPRWSAARSRAGGGRGACGAGAHLDDRHAHEPQQAPALLVVLARHAHGALAVLGHVRLAAGLCAGALGRPAGLRSARAPARRRRAARAHLLRLLQRLGGRVAALRPAAAAWTQGQPPPRSALVTRPAGAAPGRTCAPAPPSSSPAACRQTRTCARAGRRSGSPADVPAETRCPAVRARRVHGLDAGLKHLGSPVEHPLQVAARRSVALREKAGAENVVDTVKFSGKCTRAPGVVPALAGQPLLAGSPHHHLGRHSCQHGQRDCIRGSAARASAHQELVDVHARVHRDAPAKVVIEGLFSATSRRMVAKELGQVLPTQVPRSEQLPELPQQNAHHICAP